jgi:hypothetical protein
MILLEINEFNESLIEEIARDNRLLNIQKILSLHRTQIGVSETYESSLLEPWVQWVTIHTGRSAAEHKIKHLGDVPSLNHPQIWESLASLGIKCAVWGAMNASRNNSCVFFLPDPWTFSENAYPKELDGFLDLARYLAKNYLNVSPRIALWKALRLFSALAKHGLLQDLIKELPGYIFSLVKFRLSHFVTICFAERILTKAFCRLKSKYQPEFSVIFLNSIAHLQHHNWVRSDPRQYFW